MRRGGVRVLIALAVALFSLFTYFSSSQKNPVTGEKQRVGSITPRQEIALGLQAAPQMMRQYGGESRDSRANRLVDEVGNRLLTQSKAGNSPYQYEFHLLDDEQTINAFALPGGQIFITEALFRRLETEGQLAGVLAHEIGHVVNRHSAQQLAKQQLTQGLTGAAVIAAYDPDNPSSRSTAAVAAAIGSLVNMKFGRDDELESDRFGVEIMANAGYDPRAMVRVMEILRDAGGGRSAPEFFSTHPNPENRIARIEEAVQQVYPNGVPSGLKK
ncbi:MAG: M48 family metallopeptidase [Armatimonadaceae bacterium]